MLDQPIEDDELAALFALSVAPDVIALGVSGGADSMALLHLFARYRDLVGRPLLPTGPCADVPVIVATVDHGLRAASKSEAEFVAGHALALGFEHVVLPWLGDKSSSGLQNAAREARYRLLKGCVLDRGATCGVIGVAHHRDDQAETVLMRLARGSGVDGLKGMRREDGLRLGGGVTIWRPFLGIAKSRLRATLTRDGVAWIEDPSNQDRDFERVRLRGAVAAREVLGLSDASIERTARRLERAHVALGEISKQVFRSNVRLHDGAYCEFDAAVFKDAPDEIVLRVVSLAIEQVTGACDPPNLSKLEDLVAAIVAHVRNGVAFRARTLRGCIVDSDSGAHGGGAQTPSAGGPRLRFFCEPGRLDLLPVILEPGQARVWGGRFAVSLIATARAPLTIKALGACEYAQQRKDYVGDGLIPARAGATLPSFWHKERLVYVPHLNYCADFWDDALPGIKAVEVASLGRTWK